MESNQDVFISHSSADSKLAYAMCDYLEEKGIRCWIAPRDVQGGTEYAEAIIMGIRNCKIMVVLFNKNANDSIYVKNEVERAFNYKTILIPFKLDQTIASATLELFLGSVHSLDATKGNPEAHFDLLYQNCARALGKKESPIKEKPILPLTHEKKESPIKEKSGHYQEEKNSLANKENESKKKKSIILIASLGAILLISIFFYKVDEGEVTIGSNSSVEGAIGNQRDQSNSTFEVSIGSQVWTTKNLDVETYCNGDAIPQVQDAAAWKNLKTGAWCYYENNTANGSSYGKLYNWYAVNDPRGLAPKGYHIPTDAEWKILTDYLGGESVAWLDNGTNETGFMSLDCGYRTHEGVFMGRGKEVSYWNSNDTGVPFAWRVKFTNSNEIQYLDILKSFGFSVRCLRD